MTIANTGDAVKWTNSDTKSHQVVANNGSFASPTIAAGKSYTHVFNTAGTYRYHDALHPSLTGKVVVNGPPPAVTIGATVPILDYGQSTHISGTVSNNKAGETVTCGAQPYGQASPVLLATVLTATERRLGRRRQADAAHDLPGALEETVSQQIGVQLRPTRHVLGIEAHGLGQGEDQPLARGQEGLRAEVHTFHQWVKVRARDPRPELAKLFLLELPRGDRYAVRIFMSLNQVGAGYLDGFSRTVVVKAAVALFRIRGAG